MIVWKVAHFVAQVQLDEVLVNQADSKLFFVFLSAFLDLYLWCHSFSDSVIEVLCLLPSHTRPIGMDRDHPLSETRIITTLLYNKARVPNFGFV